MTLPGVVREVRGEGGRRLLCSCPHLHHYLAPVEATDRFRSGRTGHISIEGQPYCIEDLEEVGPDGTLLRLSAAFHRALEPGEDTLTVQAALRPEEWVLPGLGFEKTPAAASTQLLTRVVVEGPITALAVNPQTQHLVLGLATGAYQVLGSERFRSRREVSGTRATPAAGALAAASSGATGRGGVPTSGV